MDVGPERCSALGRRLGWLGYLGGCGPAVLLALVLQGSDSAYRLRQRGLEQRRRLAQAGLHATGQLGQQHLAGLQASDLGDLRRRDRLALENAALDDQSGVGLRELAQTLRRLDRVAGHEGNRGRTGEQRVEAADASLDGGPLR